MKVLFIGGTGLISSACSELALERGIELYILNRGQSTKHPLPKGAKLIQGDMRGDPAALKKALGKHEWDSVVDWVAYTIPHIQRDVALFTGRTRQFIFISSASCYQRPASHYLVTESTPLANPFNQYSRDKIECEELLTDTWRADGFPMTIVRPSLTYGPSQIPMCVGSWQHPWTIMDRMQRGLPIIVPGDGSSLWVLTWNGDFAKGIVGLLGREQTVGHAFHITSDEVLTWDAIYKEAAGAIGVVPNIVHIPSDLIVAYDPGILGSLVGDKSTSVVFDNSKIKRFVPDFTCTVPWAQGVRRCVDWFMSQKKRRMIDTAANAKWDDILRGYARALPDA